MFKLALLTFLLLAAPVWAQETCTTTPCASDGSNPACDTVAEITTKINAASDTNVVCLKRGSSWVVSSAISYTGDHTDANRILVCASDASICTESGAANPRFSRSTEGQFIVFNGDGITIRNVDFAHANIAGNMDILSFPHLSEDITIEGGVMSGGKFGQGSSFGDANGAVVTNLRLGTCAKPIEVTGYQQNQTGALWFGSCRNCYFSFNLHDWGQQTANGGQSHIIDLAAHGGSGGFSLMRPQNVTIECSTIDWNNTVGSNTERLGSFLKLTFGDGVVIRDNVISEQVAMPYGQGYGVAPGFIDVEGHGGAPWTEGIQNVAIYRNHFISRGSGIMDLSGAQGFDVYNNVFELDVGSGCGPGNNDCIYAYVLNMTGPCGGGACDPNNSIDFHNNTVLLRSGTTTDNRVKLLAVSGTNDCTDCRLRNNVVYTTGTQAGDIVDSVGSCGYWGTNGVNISNNFLYAANDTSMGLAWEASCSGDANNSSSPYSTAPNLNDPLNTAATVETRFAVTCSGASNICGYGSATGAPSTDYAGNTRPNPPSAGAFDTGGGGGSGPSFNGSCSGCTLSDAHSRALDLVACVRTARGQAIKDCWAEGSE